VRFPGVSRQRRVHMLELLRKAALAGLGVVTLKEEKVKEIVNDLIEQGELSKEEGNHFVKELRERLEKNKADLEKRLGEILKRTLDKMNLPTKEELNRLEEAQRDLVARLERLERGDSVGKENLSSR
jgi:polyhydroxyalkanoate synthesis regulator phasin